MANKIERTKQGIDRLTLRQKQLRAMVVTLNECTSLEQVKDMLYTQTDATSLSDLVRALAADINYLRDEFGMDS